MPSFSLSTAARQRPDPPVTEQPTAVAPEKPGADEFGAYMVGTWEFLAAVPNTRIVNTYETEFASDGRFSETRSVGGFLQDASAGTWTVLPVSSNTFTLTLNYQGADPKAVTLRVIDHNSADSGKNFVARRIR